MVPKLFGLCRALGRFCSLSHDTFLVSKLYPPKSAAAAAAAAASAAGNNSSSSTSNLRLWQNKTYSNFRSIIPRSLSMTFENGSEAALLCGSQESIVDLRYF